MDTQRPSYTLDRARGVLLWPEIRDSTGQKTIQNFPFYDVYTERKHLEEFSNSWYIVGGLAFYISVCNSYDIIVYLFIVFFILLVWRMARNCWVGGNWLRRFMEDLEIWNAIKNVAWKKYLLKRYYDLKGKILLCLFIFTHSDISDIKCLNICMDIFRWKNSVSRIIEYKNIFII